MKNLRLAHDFEIVHRTEVRFEYGLNLSTRTPFEACTCKGSLCTCTEAAPIILGVHLDRFHGKRKFVRVLAYFTGSYSVARRLWAVAKNHKVRR